MFDGELLGFSVGDIEGDGVGGGTGLSDGGGVVGLEVG